MVLANPMYGLCSIFTDKCGIPLAGGLVYTYESSSLTPKPTYTNAYMEVPNTNPVVLDEAGRAEIFLDGDYRVQVFSRDGALIDDRNGVSNIIDLTPIAEKVDQFNKDIEATINAIRQAGLKVQLTSSTSFAEPDIVFGLYAVQREFSIARQDAHIASADTEQQIKVGVFKNDILFCEIIFLQNSHQFNFLSDLTEFVRGDVIRLKLTEFHYSVKEIAVSLLGRFKIYEE